MNESRDLERPSQRGPYGGPDQYSRPDQYSGPDQYSSPERYSSPNQYGDGRTKSSPLRADR